MANRVKDGTTEPQSTKKTAAKSGAVRAKTETARKTVSEAYSVAREKASSAYGSARERSAAVYETARTQASEAGHRAVTTLDENPVAALVGGLALGALVGVLLPRSRRESELLSGVGEQINQTSRRVADAARDSARETLDGIGLNSQNVLDKVNSVFDTATKAFSTVGAAAQGAARKKP